LLSEISVDGTEFADRERNGAECADGRQIHDVGDHLEEDVRCRADGIDNGRRFRAERRQSKCKHDRDEKALAALRRRQTHPPGFAARCRAGNRPR
jgi:hypothetical protein